MRHNCGRTGIAPRGGRRTRRAALLLALLACTTTSAATTYERSVAVPGIAAAAPGISPHGINGLNFGPDGALYAASVIGPGIYRIDVASGAVTEVVGAPLGEGDDVAVGADGTLVWTALIAGELRVRRPDGQIATLERNLPLVNPVNFTADGRLFAGQITQPDTLFEIDPLGRRPRRLVGRDLGGINAFVDDGAGGLYVPLAEKGAVGRIDLASGAVTVIASGLGQPVAVKRDSKGGLVTIDWPSGAVFHVDPQGGAMRRITVVDPPLDNVAIGADDTIYVSRPADNSVIAVDPVSGAQRAIVQGRLVAPGGLAVAQRDGRTVLAIADAMGYRYADPAGGRVELLPFDLASNGSSAIAVGERTIAISYVRRATVNVIDRATGRVLHALKGFEAPMGIAMLTDGTVFVADYARGEILRLAPGSQPDRSVLTRGLRGPTGLAVDARGGLLVTEASAGTVLRVDPRDGSTRQIAAGLAQPEGLAALPDGDIAVAEVGARRLSLLARRGGARRVIAEGLPVGQMFTRAPAPVYLPTGVASDVAGAIYVTCDLDNSVLKFTPRPAAPVARAR